MSAMPSQNSRSPSSSRSRSSGVSRLSKSSAAASGDPPARTPATASENTEGIDIGANLQDLSLRSRRAGPAPVQPTHRRLNGGAQGAGQLWTHDRHADP